VAIGLNAGENSQGTNSIAIGKGAGLGTTNAQASNSIIINATGNEVDGVASQSSSFYVTPIRNVAATSGVLQYNSSTYEITYSNTISTSSTITIANTNTSTSTSTGALTVAGGVGIQGNLNVGSYSNHFIATGSITNTSALTIAGNVYGRGGIGYLDAITLTNNYIGATNPNKWFRVDSGGTLQIINSAYSTNIFNLTDAGALTVPGPIYVNGNQAVNGPSFQVYLLQAQAFTTGSTANVIYQGTLYDTHSCYNTTTGVFKPTVAGYYQFNWTAGANSYPASSGIVTSSLKRNNQEYARGWRGICNSGGLVVGGSAQCYLNGSTDYVQVSFLQGSGGTAYLECDQGAITNNPPGSYANYFSGSMVRGA
jgi:hypothetical protein